MMGGAPARGEAELLVVKEHAALVFSWPPLSASNKSTDTFVCQCNQALPVCPQGRPLYTSCWQHIPVSRTDNVRQSKGSVARQPQQMQKLRADRATDGWKQGKIV